MRWGEKGAVALAGLAAALALAACEQAASEPGSDAVLRVYLSLPLHGPAAADGRDAADGARLALAEAGAEAGGVEVRGVALDAAAPGTGWSAARSAANARRASEDSTAVALIGDLESGATRGSLPVTNEARLLQVSPASSADDLVREPGTFDDVPGLAQPSGERSFGRVIPADGVQAEAAAGWAARLGLRRVRLLDDGTAYGEGYARAFAAAGRERGLRISAGELPGALARPGELDPLARARALSAYARWLGGSGGRADLLFLAAQPGLRPDELAALGAPLGVRALGAGDAILAGDPLAGVPAAALAERLGGLPPLRVVAAAQDPSQLPPAGREFARRFADEYRRPPGPLAAYGYEAMALVLEAIGRASNPSDREAVTDAFFAMPERDSVLGRYAIDGVGDTTLARLGAYELRAGRLRPVEPPPAR